MEPWRKQPKNKKACAHGGLCPLNILGDKNLTIILKSKFLFLLNFKRQKYNLCVRRTKYRLDSDLTKDFHARMKGKQLYI